MIANLHRLDTVKANPLEWLWFPCIARGALTVIEGEPSVGKSLLLIDLLARLSRGGVMPDGQTPSGEVRSLFLTPEVSLERHLLPRLQAAGAKAENIFSYAALGGDALDLSEDLAKIQEMLDQEAIDVLVIDSLEAFVPEPLRSRHHERLRKLLANLANLAASKNVAIVVVTQFEGTKRSAFGAIGSVSVTLRVRPGERDTERIVEMTRSVIGPRQAPSLFRFVGDREVRIEWMERTEPETPRPEASRPEASRPGPPANELERAKAWLAELMLAGPCWVALILAKGEVAGFSQRTIERARVELGLLTNSTKVEGKRQFFWLTRDQGQATPPLPLCAG